MCLGMASMICCCAQSCKTQSRIPYLFIMFVSVAVALILRYYFERTSIDLMVYTYSVCDSSRCIGFGAVYRISFCLFLFYAMHAFGLMFRKGLEVHQGYWVCKLLFLMASVIVSYFIPNDLFDGYAQAARVISSIFLVLQIIILIDFAYVCKEKLVPDTEEQQETCDALKWQAPFLILCVIFFAGSLAMFVFELKWFGGSGCDRNIALIALTFVLTFIVCMLQIFASPNGNLLTSAVVTAYCYFLVWTAMSNDESTCNTLSSDGAANIAVGIAIAALSITFAGYSLSNSQNLFSISKEEEEAAAVELEAKKEAEKDEEKAESKPEEDPEETEREYKVRVENRKFHLIMMMCAMYMAMVLTNWGSPESNGDEKHPEKSSAATTSNAGEISLWVRIASQWLTLILYVKTLYPDACMGSE